VEGHVAAGWFAYACCGWDSGVGAGLLREAQPGASSWVPSPGFEPVDPGQYGSNPFFAGRGSAVQQATGAGGALSSYAGSSSAQLQALLRALAGLDPAALSGALSGGGLKIAE
jgi:hypothetical protein